MTPVDLAHLAEHMARRGISQLELASGGRQYRLVTDQPPTIAAPPAKITAAEQATIRASLPGTLRLVHPLRDKAEIEPGAPVRAGQIVAYLEAGDLLLPVISPFDGRAGAWCAPAGALTGYGGELLTLSRSA